MTDLKKNEKIELTYFISEKPPFAVITFVGAMVKATIQVLDDCERDLLSRTGTLWVVVFRDVTTLDLTALAPLAKLQKNARTKGALRLCSIRSELKKLLVEKAVIRDTETLDNLTEALDSLKDQARTK
jgi:anti-anti-sigma regulatory factor